MDENNMGLSENYGINVHYEQSQNMQEIVVNKKQPRKKKWVFYIVLVLILFFVGLSSLYIYQEKFKDNENNTDNGESNNLVSEEIKLTEKELTLKKIPTNIDFASIFKSSHNYHSLYGDNINKIAFSNNRIYYSYNSYDCSNDFDVCSYDNLDELIKYCEESRKKICSSPDINTILEQNPDYCDDGVCKSFYEGACPKPSEKSLCSSFNDTEETGYYRYVLSSNLDGTDFINYTKSTATSTLASFDYIVDDSVYFYFDGDVGKVDKDGNFVVFKEAATIAKGLSDDTTLALFEDNGKNLVYYDAITMKEKNKIVVNSPKKFWIDAVTNDFYYVNFSKKNNKYDFVLFQNGKEVFHEVFDYNFDNIIIGDKYIYLFLKENQNIKVAKIDKKNFSLEKISSSEVDNVNFVSSINVNGKVYVVENDGLYIFNEQKEEFNLILPATTFLERVGHFKDYIYFMKFNTSKLTLYNTSSNEKMSVDNVVYVYLNNLENRLYIVQFINNDYELSYYDMD